MKKRKRTQHKKSREKENTKKLARASEGKENRMFRYKVTFVILQNREKDATKTCAGK